MRVDKPANPGVYIAQQYDEFGAGAISGVDTSITAFIGRTASGPANAPASIGSFDEFETLFGGRGRDLPVSYAVEDFFNNGGSQAIIVSTDTAIGSEEERTGMYALEAVPLFNLVVIPPDSLLKDGADTSIVYGAAAAYCARRRAVLIADPSEKWSDFNISDIASRRSVFAYFPRVKKLDPEGGNQERVFAASGMIAGVFAATDVRRGVWKAPAGIEAGLNGVTALQHDLTDVENGVLNAAGINALRNFPVIGTVIWGSRTLAGADALCDDYKYLAVRRLSNYIEQSILQGIKFAVFEPNGEALWSKLRDTIGAFMAGLCGKGAIYDYEVRCGLSTTMTPDDISEGKVIVSVSFSPEKPGEFLVLMIQQVCLGPA